MREKACIFHLLLGVTSLPEIIGIDMSDPGALVASDNAMIDLKITTYFWILFATKRYRVSIRKA